MSVLKPSPISTDRLTYHRDSNLLVAWDSDLPRPARVYDDAADAGYTLVSHRTGRQVVYVEHAYERKDGDLLYWDLIPVEPSDRHLPTLRVYND
jgi:hypothetical protein